MRGEKDFRYRGKDAPSFLAVKPETIQLCECNCLDGVSASGDEPVLKHVKVIGWESKNRRQYLPESVEPSLYEGMAVNLNHPASPTESRRLEDRFGRLTQITKEADGAYGNLHFNPAHPMAARVKWWAENDPSALGLSHNAVGQGKTKDGVFIVEKVISVRSVDLVADPATTKGLYEAMNPDEMVPPAEGAELSDLEAHVSDAVKALCTDSGMSDKEKVAKFKAALKILAQGEEDEENTEEEEEEEGGEEKKETEEEEEEKPEKVEESLKVLASKNRAVKSLLERVDSLETDKRLRERREKVQELIEAAKLPALAVTETFMEQLIAAKDEKQIKKLIEDRKAIATVKKPVSTGPVHKKASTNSDKSAVVNQLAGIVKGR